MTIGFFIKLMLLMLWPVLLLFIYYLVNKEGFKRKYKKIREELFKKP